MEGGFDSEGTFYYLPYRNLERMTEYFRRKLIKLFGEKELINEEFARNLLSWKHSGFSIDNSAKCFDTKSQESLAEYISRPPISLQKLRYDRMHGRILWHTKYNRYFGQNVKMMDGASVHTGVGTAYPAKKNTAYSCVMDSIRREERARGPRCNMWRSELHRRGKKRTECRAQALPSNRFRRPKR